MAPPAVVCVGWRAVETALYGAVSPAGTVQAVSHCLGNSGTFQSPAWSLLGADATFPFALLAVPGKAWPECDLGSI